MKLLNISHAEMTIFIIQQNAETIVLHVVKSKTIGHVKKMIEDIRRDTSCDHHTLVYDGKKLEENKSLSDYSIVDYSELELVGSGQFSCTYVLVLLSVEVHVC